MAIKQRDVTREKILDAAFCEMHRHGFQAASIADILADTGLTKGALYHHFPTKHDLGIAVIEDVIKVWLEKRIFERLRDSAQPVDALLEIIDTMGRNATDEIVRLGCPLNNLMQEMSPLDEGFKARLTAIIDIWRHTVADALRRGQEQKVIQPDVDCQATALFIVSAWEGCIGVAKNLQSVAALSQCMGQLHRYISGLKVGDGGPG